MNICKSTQVCLSLSHPGYLEVESCKLTINDMTQLPDKYVYIYYRLLVDEHLMSCLHTCPVYTVCYSPISVYATLILQ